MINANGNIETKYVIVSVRYDDVKYVYSRRRRNTDEGIHRDYGFTTDINKATKFVSRIAANIYADSRNISNYIVLECSVFSCINESSMVDLNKFYSESYCEVLNA